MSELKPESVKVLIIGDLMLDRYVIGDASRISPEAPVPVFNKEKIKDVLGGAANVAKNIVELGAKAELVGVIGDDSEGKELAELIKSSGITADSIIIDKNRPTTVKKRIVTSELEQLLRIDTEKKDKISEEDEDKIISAISEKAGDASIIVLSDYAKGVMTDKIVEAAKQTGKKVLVDPKPVNAEIFKGVEIITPNLKESREIVNSENSTSEEIGKTLSEKLNCKVLMTMGAEGMMLVSNGTAEQIPVEAKEVYDVTGAGDTVAAVLAVALASGINDLESAKLANKAAGFVIGKRRVHKIDLREALK
jgi:D-beta-D-heptose 7-phosphate kinase/D-beta-D-heptose 1-phosphate adenosyltransferase|tara:strand:- start:229 stop:1149 length:921 start_codon:yes stop_codon:yes gene_type:complete